MKKRKGKFWAIACNDTIICGTNLTRKDVISEFIDNVEPPEVRKKSPLNDYQYFKKRFANYKAIKVMVSEI